MNPQLPAEASDFGTAAEKAFTALGGVDVARRAEADPGIRAAEIGPLLRSLGVEDLDPRTDLDTAAAAAELCRVAGRVALPFPVAGVLLRGPGGEPTTVVRTTGVEVAVDHGDLFPAWSLTTLEGNAVVAAPSGGRLGSRLGPFVCRVDARGPATEGPAKGGSARAAAVSLVLGAWRALGCVQRALELAVEHVRDREQFGQKLSEFQAVQFQLADAAVAVTGLDELCRYTTWSWWANPDQATTDALALRLCALETARSVLRTAQQLHGAAGVCDEYDVSVLSRHIQPELRLPLGASSTAEQLAAAVDRYGFAALFPQAVPPS